jgi:hypothetical protein
MVDGRIRDSREQYEQNHQSSDCFMHNQSYKAVFITFSGRFNLPFSGAFKKRFVVC